YAQIAFGEKVDRPPLVFPAVRSHDPLRGFVKQVDQLGIDGNEHTGALCFALELACDQEQAIPDLFSIQAAAREMPQEPVLGILGHATLWIDGPSRLPICATGQDQALDRLDA